MECERVLRPIRNTRENRNATRRNRSAIRIQISIRSKHFNAIRLCTYSVYNSIVRSLKRTKDGFQLVHRLSTRFNRISSSSFAIYKRRGGRRKIAAAMIDKRARYYHRRGIFYFRSFPRNERRVRIFWTVMRIQGGRHL